MPKSSRKKITRFHDRYDTDPSRNRRRRRAGLVAAILSGAGLGALIGLVVGYLLGPRAPGTKPEQLLSAWRDVAHKLSEQLQTDRAGEPPARSKNL